MTRNVLITKYTHKNHILKLFTYILKLKPVEFQLVIYYISVPKKMNLAAV